MEEGARGFGDLGERARRGGILKRLTFSLCDRCRDLPPQFGVAAYALPTQGPAFGNPFNRYRWSLGVLQYRVALSTTYTTARSVRAEDGWQRVKNHRCPAKQTNLLSLCRSPGVQQRKQTAGSTGGECTSKYARLWRGGAATDPISGWGRAVTTTGKLSRSEFWDGSEAATLSEGVAPSGLAGYQRPLQRSFYCTVRHSTVLSPGDRRLL